MPLCVLKHSNFWLSENFYSQIFVINAPKDGLQAFCEWFHQQSWQVVLMGCVGKIVEGCHNRDVIFDEMKGFVFADGAILCAENVDGHLEAFLPLIGHCEYEDAADFKRMPIQGFHLQPLLDDFCILFGNLRVQMLGKRDGLREETNVLINGDVFLNEGKRHDLCQSCFTPDYQDWLLSKLMESLFDRRIIQDNLRAFDRLAQRQNLIEFLRLDVLRSCSVVGQQNKRNAKFVQFLQSFSRTCDDLSLQDESPINIYREAQSIHLGNH